MKLTGIQYYWLIFIGLIIGLAASIPEFDIYEEFLTPEILEENDKQFSLNLAVFIPIVLLLVYCTICYFVAVFEIWSIFTYKLIIAIILIYLAGEYLHALLFWLYEITPTAYWLWRINGLNIKNT